MTPEDFDKEDWKKIGALEQSVKDHGRAIGDLSDKTDGIVVDVGVLKSTMTSMNGKLDKALERRSGGNGSKKQRVQDGATGGGISAIVTTAVLAALYWLKTKLGIE